MAVNKPSFATKSDNSVDNQVINVEQQLRQDELILDSIFTALSDLFFLMDYEGTILDYRANEDSDLYVQPEMFLGKKMHEVLSEPAAILFDENRLVLLAADKELVTFDYELEFDKGKKQFQARILKLPKISKIIAIIQDITERTQIEIALKISESIYRQMFEKNQAIKLIIDPTDGAIIEANKAAVEFYGYKYQDLISKNIFDLNLLTKQEILKKMELAKQEKCVFFDFQHQTATGEIKHVEVYSGPINIADKTFLFSIVQDVTKKKCIENKLKQTEQRFRDLFNNINAEIFIKDLQGKYILVNDNLLNFYGINASDIIDKTDQELFSQDKAKLYRQSDLDTIKMMHSIILEDTVEVNKCQRYYSTTKFPLINPNGQVYAVCGISTDITDTKIAEEKILHQAHFDTLTNLPNRFLSLDRLEQMLKEAQRNDEKVAVLFLDLDDFKKINDTLGHEVGDKLLIESAKRLKSIIRDEDTVGRLGGDEFIVILRGITNSSDVQPVTEALLNKFRQPFSIDNRELILTSSVGIAVYPDDAESVSEILRNADTAMYQAKDLGRNGFSYFTQSMNQNVSRRLAVEEQIRGALERDEFDVHYQIQLDMKSEKIIGAEALLRWHNCVLGNITPDEFIPVAEQTGLIVCLGQFVLNQALATIKQWQNRSHGNLRIAVNLSPRQFRDPELVGFVEKALINADVAASNLELEITEGVLLSGHSYIDKALTSLNKLGVILSMDDFGTGYSSLSYLRTYPFDVLKVDRCFVSGIIENNADKELVNATIAMSHALGLKVVAEGVETKEQYHMLAQLGCDYAQGYLLSKPVPKNELFALADNFSF
ncbi:MAG: GGDEF domain-containing protein [Gammaproteobacteria bacterium]|nr:MAG: GGDEF domain-containing protein [Gammaproteobacteria bacterium]